MVGGMIVSDETRILKQGVHVIVGTPGRVLDMMKNGSFKTEYLKVLILYDTD